MVYQPAGGPGRAERLPQLHLLRSQTVIQQVPRIPSEHRRDDAGRKIRHAGTFSSTTSRDYETEWIEQEVD